MDGQIFPDTPRKSTDARTAVGVDSEKRLLFLGVFENASESGGCGRNAARWGQFHEHGHRGESTRRSTGSSHRRLASGGNAFRHPGTRAALDKVRTRAARRTFDSFSISESAVLSNVEKKRKYQIIGRFLGDQNRESGRFRRPFLHELRRFPAHAKNSIYGNGGPRIAVHRHRALCPVADSHHGVLR
jgi:hypothetical protein